MAAELYVRGGASRYGLTATEFAAILAQIAHKYAPEADSEHAARLLNSLAIEDLALARGCAAGNEAAWQDFLIRFRERLYDAARAIAKEDVSAHELADSLYADLYGTNTRDGQRVSKLASYSGRGSLEGWLRTVLAQEFVNRYRSGKKNVSLEEQEAGGTQFAAAPATTQCVADTRLDAAVEAALVALTPEEKFIVAAYFLDGRTLAEIGRLLGVHESTISRKVERITASLRKRLLQELVSRGMSKRQAEEALETDVRDVTANVRGRLAQESARAPFLGREEKK